MANTYNFGLPLVEAAQAQKHVTVNEAISRVDAISQMRVKALGVTTPPVAMDGTAYGIGPGATDDWAGHDGEIAVRSNGGWVFIAPKQGWRGWDEAQMCVIVYDGTDWQSHALMSQAGGAGTGMKIIEIDHTVSVGATSTTVNVIPANSVVIGVTGRVVSPMSGSGVSSWKLGVAGANDRYGSGLGLGLNSWAHGLTSSPLAYYSDTPLVISANAGSFTGGAVRLCVHLMALTLPRAV